MTDTKGTFSNGEDEWQNRSLSPEFVGSIPTVSICPTDLANGSDALFPQKNRSVVPSTATLVASQGALAQWLGQSSHKGLVEGSNPSRSTSTLS